MASASTASVPLQTALQSAIPIWRDALRLPAPQAAAQLRRIYRENRATQGELIFTGACSFQCQHCIYPPSFARHNKSIDGSGWDHILESMVRDCGIDTFVYGGRAVTADGARVMTKLRESWPDVRIGMIDNGISMLPHMDALAAVRADWIDVSLDGLAADHDAQRGKVGSFEDGLRGAIRLKDGAFAPRVNILTCLTTLNFRSVCAMIRQVNSLGFKNFFVTPITLGDGVGPAPELMLSRDQFAQFVAELRETVADLDDAWVELLLFSADYADYLASALPDFWRDCQTDRDSLFWDGGRPASGADGANVLFIRYYPLSLTGVRELIVNTNGDVIVPKSMVAGKINDRSILGNLLEDSPRALLAKLPDSNTFDYYCAELRREAGLLRSVA